MVKAKIRIMESQVEPLHFLEIFLPKIGEEGPEVITLHNTTHLHLMIPIDDKPDIVFVGEPSYTPLDEQLFGKLNLEDFMRETFRD